VRPVVRHHGAPPTTGPFRHTPIGARPMRTSAIVTFPREDATFAAYVDATIRRLGPAECDDPAVVQRALRQWHTRAIVQPQDELAAFRMGRRAWYIYRDGKAGVRSEQDWWQAPGVATSRLGEDEVFIDGDAAACALVDRPPGGKARVPWRGPVPPRRSGHGGDRPLP